MTNIGNTRARSELLRKGINGWIALRSKMQIFFKGDQLKVSHCFLIFLARSLVFILFFFSKLPAVYIKA